MAIVNRESSRKDFRRREDIIYGRVMDIEEIKRRMSKKLNK